MTAGKSKKNYKKAKTQKKQTDPFAKKEWYDVKTPAPFAGTVVTKTPVNKTTGLKIASDNLKGRVFEVSVSDIAKNDTENFHQLVRLRIDDVKGKTAFSTFGGYRLTNDKLRSLVKKWHTLVRAQVDTKTSDGYVLRVFSIATTKRRQLQVRKTTYAQSSQVMRMVTKMKDLLRKYINESDITEFTKLLTSGGLASKLERAASTVFPLQNTFIYKVKVLKRPKIDAARLSALYKDFDAAPKVEEEKVVEETDE